MDKCLDAIVFIAEHGRNYYLNKYHNGNGTEKYVLYRLGVQSVRPPVILSSKNKREFLLVSCSSVIPRKRVRLIVDGLQEIESFPIRWVHFGDGTEFKDIEKYAHEKLDHMDNISYEFKGLCKTEEIMQFYRDNEADAFITTTQSEGCPMSIQEAMACGIPIIGTAVAEIPYMIRGNGYLLSENPSGSEIGG